MLRCTRGRPTRAPIRTSSLATWSPLAVPPTSPAAGSTRATSSSSPTPRPTPTACSGPHNAGSGARRRRTLAREARFGLDWLGKAWHPLTGVLDLQVGIGSGDQAGTYFGDHDLWRLPQKDDELSGSKARFIRHRPVFEANAPLTPLPPNLAGRVAAAFALAAQVDAAAQPVPGAGRARHRGGHLRGRQGHQRDASGCGHGAAACLLPGVVVARRHGAGRRGAGAGRAGARRCADGRLADRRRTLGQCLPCPRGRRGHAQPVRHQRPCARRPRDGHPRCRRPRRPRCRPGGPAEGPARPARAGRQPCRERPFRGRCARCRVRRRRAHLRAAGDGAAVPRPDPRRPVRGLCLATAWLGASAPTPGASR